MERSVKLVQEISELLSQVTQIVKKIFFVSSGCYSHPAATDNRRNSFRGMELQYQECPGKAGG
jgi:hypothetical protein